MGIMYHITASENRASILANGLSPRFDRTGLGAVFLADTYCCAPTLDIWQVDTDGLALEEDFTGEPGEGQWWMLFDSIAPTRLTLLETNIEHYYGT